MRRGRRLLGIAGLAVAGAITACAALLDLPPLEVIRDDDAEAGRDPRIDAEAGTTNDGSEDGPTAEASCTDVNPVVEWCPRCGVGCTDGATCNVFPEPCADGGPLCCPHYQCKNSACAACATIGGNCGGVPCCSPLRCRSTDNKCVTCGVVGASCDAVTTSTCCSNNCDIVAGKCK